MNKKHIIRWIIAVAAITTIAVALPIVGSESDHKNVTLESIETRILGNNLEVVRVNENVMIAEYKFDEAEDNMYDGGTAIESRKKVDFYPIEAQMNLDFAIWTQSNTKESVVLDGINQYYTYQLLLEEITLENNKIKRLEEALETVNLKIDLGNATINDRTSATLAIEQEKFTMQKLINDRDRLFLDLNVLMKYDLDTQLVLEKVTVPFEIYATENVGEDVTLLLATNGDLAKLEDQLNLARIELKIYNAKNTSGSYDTTIISIKEAVSKYNLDIKDKKLSLEYDVRSKYNAVLSAYDSVLIKELELEDLQLTLDINTNTGEIDLADCDSRY